VYDTNLFLVRDVDSGLNFSSRDVFSMSRSRLGTGTSRSRDMNDSVSSRSRAFYVSRRSVSRDAPMFNMKIVKS